MAELSRTRASLCESARADSTRATYRRWREEFALFRERVDPGGRRELSDALELFVCDLHKSGRGGSARQAIAAVVFDQATKGVQVGRGRRLALLVDGAEREAAKGAVRPVRDPFPVAALRTWVTAHDGTWPGVTLRDACLVALGLRTMRRAGELAALRLDDVRDDGVRLAMRIRRSKTDQLARGHDVFVEPTGRPWCPVRLWRLWTKRRGGAPSDLVFTSASGGPMTTNAITAACKRMVAAAGLRASVSSHSLRIGGATAAMEGGLSKEQIMSVGGWRSDAVERYLRAREVVELEASAKMGF